MIVRILNKSLGTSWFAGCSAAAAPSTNQCSLQKLFVFSLLYGISRNHATVDSRSSSLSRGAEKSMHVLRLPKRVQLVSIDSRSSQKVYRTTLSNRCQKSDAFFGYC